LKTVARDNRRKASGHCRPEAGDAQHSFRDDGTTDTAAASDLHCCAKILSSRGLQETAFVVETSRPHVVQLAHFPTQMI
jgi:hypothetical protein